jgi:hypothetical protein
MENSLILTKVKEYEGNNNFILSLKSGLNKYGSLTPKQLSAADNFFSKLEVPTNQISDSKNINVNLNSYINKDPLVARQNMLKQIQEEEDDIIIQLEKLRKTKG